MTNFDFLLEEEKFSGFANTAITAEKLYQVDIPSCLFNVRRALEFAVKWMYSVDKDLEMPYDTNLITLMSSEDFRDVVGNDIYRRMDFIRKAGNIAAHGGKKISMEQAKLCIENLYYFLDYVAYCYGKDYGYFFGSKVRQLMKSLFGNGRYFL